MNSLNTWNKGINQDLSYTKIGNDQYLSLSGGHVITIDGLSSGSITTEKGTKKLFNIPSSPSVYKINYIEQLNTGQNAFFNFSLNGESFSIDFTNVAIISQIRDKIVQHPTISSQIEQGNLRVDFSEQYENIVIWGSTDFVILESTDFLRIKHIPAVENLEIIGSGLFGNEFVILTASKTEESSHGVIWKFELDSATNQVMTSDELLPFGNDLIPFEHLVYSEALNLSPEYYITKVISNIETPKIGRIYWTDTNNPVATLNLRAQFPLNTPLNFIYGDEIETFGNIVIEEIIDGGFIPVGSKIQYFYRLRGNDTGSSSTTSEGSNIVALGRGNSRIDDDFKGASLNAALEDLNDDLYKSAKIKISNVDTNYQFIELIYVLYESLNSPQILKVAELPIPNSGNVEFIHDGNPENFQDFNDAAINEQVFNFTKVNDIVVKEGRMFAMGVETQAGELGWDTRAYRFNNQGESKLESKNGQDITINSATLLEDLQSVPEDHDCINPYNDGNNEINWTSNTDSRYKYQANGFTVGGTGINISYKFTTFALQANKDNSATPFNNFPRFEDGDVINLGKDRVYENLTNEPLNFRSPIVDSLLKGYAREEVYRIGFQAFDLQGNPYYTSWIGDIKMPGEYDQDDDIIFSESNFGLNSQTSFNFIIGDQEKIYSLGLEFTLNNLNEIRDRVSSYRFVMVKRDDQNKTKLAHGVLDIMHYISRSGDTPTREFCEYPYKGSQTTHLSFGVEADVTDGGTSIPPHFAFNVYTENYSPLYRKPLNFWTFKSIDELLFDKTIRHRIGDFFKPSSIYSNPVGTPSGGNPLMGFSKSSKVFRIPNNPDPNVYCMQYNVNVYRYAFPENVREFIKYSMWKEVDMSEYGSPIAPFNVDEESHTGSNPTFISAAYSRRIPILNGGGLANSIAPGRNWRSIRPRIILFEKETEKLFYNDNTPDPTENNCFILGSYKRNLQNQYGGNTFNARQNNVYQPVSPIINIDETNTTKDIVFGGDVCVDFYHMLSMNILTDNNVDNSSDPNLNSFFRNANIVTSFPTESEINPYFDTNTNWFRDELTAADTVSIVQGLGYIPNNYFKYNNVYFQKDEQQLYVPKPNFTDDNNYYPAGIFVSDNKINGERIDAWRKYRFLNSKEVDNVYGPIRAGIVFNNQLLFLQDRGFGIQSVNEKALQFNDETGTQIILGNGQLLGDHGYISTKSGTIHNSSVIDTEYGVYYYDAIQNKIKKYDTKSNLPLSDVSGIFSTIRKFKNKGLSKIDKPLLGNGVIAGSDFLTKRIFFNFIDPEEPMSICYNENMQAVEFFPNYIPSHIISGNSNVLYANPSNLQEVHLHQEGDYNTYFGEYKPMIISFVVKDNPTVETVLTNLLWKSEAFNQSGIDLPTTGITDIRVYNNYQDTGYLQDIKRVLRQWHHKVGFNSLTDNGLDRMRNTWHVIEMKFDNARAYKLILHDVISKLQVSHSGLDKY